MAWHAGTVHGQIAVGTELSIYKGPWEPGEAARSPPSGATLITRFAHGAETKIKVLKLTGSDAIIRTSNRAQWRMVEVGAKGLKFPLPNVGGAPATYWVVKERYTPTNG
jgi:hypothetical protein